MKKLIVICLIFVVHSVAISADACRSCANWANWGQRQEVCASPSEAELLAMLNCERVVCEEECASWLDGYDACALSGDPLCVAGTASEDCNLCIEGAGPYYGIGCGPETQACSFDKTGCVSCSAWLDGGDITNLCWDAIGAADSLSACACSSCASKCSAACTDGYFDPNFANFKCGTCLAGAACANQYDTCSGL